MNVYYANLVGHERRNQNGPIITANEAQQHSAITSVNEAVKSCEEFNTEDETELIDLNWSKAKEKCVSHCCTNILQSSKQNLSTEVHQFVNHLIKSPELTVSQIKLATQVIYDNAVQELHRKQLKQQQLLELEQEANNAIDNCNNQPENVKENIEKVNVRKHLQQYEDLHRQFANQIEQDYMFQKKRESAKLKAQQQNNKKFVKAATESSIKSSMQQIPEQQQEKEYVKIPVKDLITNFEQQCLQEEKLNTQSPLPPTSKDNMSMELDHQVETNEFTKDRNEGKKRNH